MEKKSTILYFLLPAILIYTAFFCLPILDSMRLSLYDANGLMVKDFVGFANYKKLFTVFPYKERLLNAFFNNIKFFVIVICIQNVFGFIIAYMVTRRMWAAPAMRKISFLPTTLSVVVVGFLFGKLIFNPVFGVIDKVLDIFGLEFLIRSWLGDPATALPVLAFVTSWQFMGQTILLYTAGLDNIPRDIIEAAEMDGAGHLALIRRIIIPYIMPVVGIVTILIFVGDFTQFDIIYTMTTTQGDPAYSTDLFGSLFYRATFSQPSMGGWGVGMGTAVSTVMSFVVFIGLAGWLIFFKKNKSFDY